MTFFLFSKVFRRSFLFWVISVVPAVANTFPDLNISEQQQTTLGIETQKTAKVDHYLSLPFSGHAMVPLNHRVLVATPTSGLIKKIQRPHGWVDAGESLLVIESPELLSREKDYLNTLSDEETKFSEYQRAERLNKTGVVSDKQKQQAWSSLNKVRQVKIQQRQDLLLLGMQEASIVKLEKTKKLQAPLMDIKAPVSGEVSGLKVQIGQRVSADAPLMKIGTLSPLAVSVQVPVNEIVSLKAGQQVMISGHEKPGEVKFISRNVDPMTQSVEVHILYPNKDLTLFPGRLVLARFSQQAAAGKNLYKINRRAISELDGQTVVFSLNGNRMTVITVTPKVFDGEDMVFETTASLIEKKVVVRSVSAVKSMLENATEGDGE